MSDLISIIIPAYNASRFIDETITCYQRQTYPHFELLIVDDGSTDDTWAKLQDHAARDSRLRIFHQANSGCSVAKDLAYQESKGDYVLFMDHDDVASPYMLADLLGLLKQYPEADYAAGFSRGDQEGLLDYPWDANLAKDHDGEPVCIPGDQALAYIRQWGSTHHYGLGTLWGRLFTRDFMRRLEPEIDYLRPLIPQHYMEDGGLMSRVWAMPTACVMSNRAYIIHRSGVGNLMYATGLQPYQLDFYLASEQNMHYYKTLGPAWHTEYYRGVRGLYLLLARTYYMVTTYETDEARKAHYLADIWRLRRKYLKDLSYFFFRVDHHAYQFKGAILLWLVSPRLFRVCMKKAKGW